MLKVIAGSAIGGLVAAALALLAANLVSGHTAAPAAPAPAVSAPATPAATCAPDQEASITRVVVNGQSATALICVPRASHERLSRAPHEVGTSGAVVRAADPAPVRVVRAGATARPRLARRVSDHTAEDHLVSDEPDVRPSAGRPAATSALIIGGSAGTGAGIGAIAGGKKGALIGAAIGGGVASIYEATKR